MYLDLTEQQARALGSSGLDLSSLHDHAVEDVSVERSDDRVELVIEVVGDDSQPHLAMGEELARDLFVDVALRTGVIMPGGKIDSYTMAEGTRSVIVHTLAGVITGSSTLTGALSESQPTPTLPVMRGWTSHPAVEYFLQAQRAGDPVARFKLAWAAMMVFAPKSPSGKEQIRKTDTWLANGPYGVVQDQYDPDGRPESAYAHARNSIDHPVDRGTDFERLASELERSINPRFMSIVGSIIRHELGFPSS
jgi:hypothetical protein